MQCIVTENGRCEKRAVEITRLWRKIQDKVADKSLKANNQVSTTAFPTKPCKLPLCAFEVARLEPTSHDAVVKGPKDNERGSWFSCSPLR